MITPERWRTKPVIVEAVQITAHNLYDVAQWCALYADVTIESLEQAKDGDPAEALTIDTGCPLWVCPGGWLVRLPDGTFESHSTDSLNRAYTYAGPVPVEPTG